MRVLLGVGLAVGQSVLLDRPVRLAVAAVAGAAEAVAGVAAAAAALPRPHRPQRGQLYAVAATARRAAGWALVVALCIGIGAAVALSGR